MRLPESPLIIYWVSRSGEGDSQEQKTTLSIRMPFDGREHDLKAGPVNAEG
jgi:hypothetical protein